MNCEGESTRPRQTKWDSPQPAQSERESQALLVPEFVDAVVSALPAEVNLSALPRWMRAVPEQGPPEELEFKARHGPAKD